MTEQQFIVWANVEPVILWWHRQMETFSALLALCAGNSPVTVNSPHKGQWRGTLMFSLIYDWINDWVNNCEAGALRRHRGHYDVIVMMSPWVSCQIRQIADAHALRMSGTFSPPPQLSNPDMYHGTCVTQRDARAVMHAGIANSRFPLNSAAGGNVPGIPGACATRNFTYLVRGP